MTNFIVTATDTDVGKTIFATALMLGIEANYWKPLQSGVEEVDTRTVQRLTELPDARFFPEKHIFSQALSPHRAAEIDGVVVDVDSIEIPKSERSLIIEGAGGLMVPVTRENLQINMFKKWQVPVILCARTGLGTINHTLLSLEALWSRKMKIHGIVFIGDENEDNIKTIAEFSKEKILGRLPKLKELNARSLKRAFDDNFRREDFI
jgi:dethiobiotin synthetase